jgi:hypothetical protein
MQRMKYKIFRPCPNSPHMNLIAIFTQNSSTPFEMSNKYINMVPNIKLAMNNKTTMHLCSHTSWKFLCYQILTTPNPQTTMYTIHITFLEYPTNVQNNHDH